MNVSSQTRYLHCRLLRVKNSTTQLFPIFCICVTTCLGTRTSFSAGYPAILEYRVMNGLMFWPRLPWIRQNSFIIYHIPYTDFKYNISVYLDDILQGEWNINVTSKLFEVQPIIKRSFTPMERRRDDVVLCRARIGHAYFTNGYLLRGELRPMCCNTRLTVRHVLLSCVKYAHIRRKYFAFNSIFELFRDTPAGFIIPSGM